MKKQQLKLENIAICDFETSITNTESTRVWLAGYMKLSDIHEALDYKKDGFKGLYYMSNISDFLQSLFENDIKLAYFHNIKFDGSFITDYLLKHNYTYVDTNTRDKEQKVKLKPNQFTSLVDGINTFYSLEICKSVRGRAKKIKIYDSLKKASGMSVANIGKSFKLVNMQKGEYDYTREIIDDVSLSYFYQDLVIPGLFLRAQHEKGHKKMTIASDSLENYKNIIGKNNFSAWFPDAQKRQDINEVMHEYCLPSYWGGKAFPKNYDVQDVEDKTILILDVNSMYPAQCYNKELPYGVPIDDALNEILCAEDYILTTGYKHIDRTLCFITIYIHEAELKDGYIPNLKIGQKQNLGTLDYEYNKWQDYVQDIQITITEPDLEYILEAYDIDYEYVSHMRFKSQKGMFKQYIDFWMNEKILGKKTKDNLRTLTAKMFLNSLTGKFGTSRVKNYQTPYLDDDVVKYEKVEYVGASIYVPVISYITAYGRQTLNNLCNTFYDEFLYCDTDSCHMTAPHEIQNVFDTNVIKDYLKNIIEIDSVKLGAWDLEGVATRGRYLRPKTYMELVDGVIDCKCCGLPLGVRQELLNFDNFKKGLAIYIDDDSLAKQKKDKHVNEYIKIGKAKKLVPKAIAGGTILQARPFCIKNK